MFRALYGLIRSGKSKLTRAQHAASRRVLVAVALLTLPSVAVATWLSQEHPFAFCTKAKIREMIVDQPGISQPGFASAASAKLADGDMVIGVAVLGEAKAYPQGRLGGPGNHIVHDRFGLTQVSVTFCDRTRCARVFTATDEYDLRVLHCGGWMAEQEMALRIGDYRFVQSSPEIPFDDLPFQVTTWGEWRKAYPNSTVYLGKPLGAPTPRLPADPVHPTSLAPPTIFASGQL